MVDLKDGGALRIALAVQLELELVRRCGGGEGH